MVCHDRIILYIKTVVFKTGSVQIKQKTICHDTRVKRSEIHCSLAQKRISKLMTHQNNIRGYIHELYGYRIADPCSYDRTLYLGADPDRGNCDRRINSVRVYRNY